MEKPQAEKANSLPCFTHSTGPTLLNFGQNLDGYEILVCPVSYRPSTKRGNGLP